MNTLVYLEKSSLLSSPVLELKKKGKLEPMADKLIFFLFCHLNSTFCFYLEKKSHPNIQYKENPNKDNINLVERWVNKLVCNIACTIVCLSNFLCDICNYINQSDFKFVVESEVAGSFAFLH